MATLLESIESELGARRPLLRFSPELEARFESDCAPVRKRHLFLAGLIGLIVFDLFLFNDYGIRPDQLQEAAWLRLGVMTPYGALALWLIRRNMRPGRREALIASALVVAMAVACAIYLISTSPLALFDPFAFGVIILCGNIVMSLRFQYALASSLLALLVMGAALSISPLMLLELKLFALMLASTVALFTLFANYRLEASERQSYLLLARERLRASEAIEHNQTLMEISYTDSLTRLANRRCFDERFAERWNEAAQRNATLGLLMIDIDNFKTYNDFYGHLAGDGCLKRVADELQRQVRSGGDLVARLGGEEFAMLLPGAPSQAAMRAGERARRAIEVLAIPHEGMRTGGKLTVSVGVAVVRPGHGQQTADLYALADGALYQAKRRGRNRCVLAGAEHGAPAVAER